MTNTAFVDGGGAEAKAGYAGRFAGWLLQAGYELIIAS
jgi:hypothetical protein